MTPGDTLSIRPAGDADLSDILEIQRRAFGAEEEAALTAALLADPTAAPVLSLLAQKNGGPAGHILFTRARPASSRQPVAAALLAPLAVVPELQGQGIGGALIAAGLRDLSDAGVNLVFVLGDPAYYGRYGFVPALPAGLEPPCPIPSEYHDAWMVLALHPGLVGAETKTARGQVRCADAISRPEFWQE